MCRENQYAFAPEKDRDLPAPDIEAEHRRAASELAKMAQSREPSPKPLDDAPKPIPRAADAATLRVEILEKLTYAVGKDPIVAQPHDWLAATSLAVRDRVIDRWMESTRDA